MSARNLELLLQTAYHNNGTPLLEGEAGSIYLALEKAHRNFQSSGRASEELHFRFERLRLVVALVLVKAFTRLAQNEKSTEVLDVLLDALKANSTKEIDKVVQKRIAVFDQLYHEIFVNEQREQILGLFEQTLDADTKEELDELIKVGLEILQETDWDAANEEDHDDTEPLDEDFLKNL